MASNLKCQKRRIYGTIKARRAEMFTKRAPAHAAGMRQLIVTLAFQVQPTDAFELYLNSPLRYETTVEALLLDDELSLTEEADVS